MSAKGRELYAAAQRRLIGSLLHDSTKLPRVMELVAEADFEEPSYALIFSAMCELSRTDQPVSAVTVAERLQEEGNLRAAGNPIALYELSREGKRYLYEAGPENYARIVKESSAKSKIHQTLTDSLGWFADDSGHRADSAVSELQSFLNEKLLSLSDDSTITEFAGDFDNYLELLEERRVITEQNEGSSDGLQGIPSLLPSLNRWTTGWLPGQLITVGAGTGVGKTVFAVNCAIAALQAGKSVMFFSLEMGTAELEDRILSATTGIPMYRLKLGKLSDEEKSLLRQQMDEMKDVKLTIDVEPGQTIDSIRARALKQAQSPAGLDMIIVDYLQLVTPVGRFGSRQEAVADMSRNMKLLAKQLGVPIMILVQMKRNDGDEEAGSLPSLDRIRESGAIAQDSDIVILLHRDKNLDGTLPHTQVILAKNRNGPYDKIVRCHSNLECSLFREVARVKDIEASGDDDAFGTGDPDLLAGEDDLGMPVMEDDSFQEFGGFSDEEDAALEDDGPFDFEGL